MTQNKDIFENLLDQITADDITGNAASTLANQDEVEDIEPTIDNFDYVVRICTIDVSKNWRKTPEETIAKVTEYVTEIIYRFEEFLNSSPKIKKRSKLYFSRPPERYILPDEIEKMVMRERGWSSNNSDYLYLTFGMNCRIRNVRDLFMMSAIFDKLAWGSSFIIEYEGKTIPTQEHKCSIDRTSPLMSMFLFENGIERYKEGSGLFNELVESYINSSMQFFGESVEVCEQTRKLFHYDNKDVHIAKAISYVTKGRTRQCDTPKFLQNALNSQYIDPDVLCNDQYITFHIMSVTDSKKTQVSSWRLKFIYEHVEKSLKINPRKITDYVMRVYDKDYIFFIFYLGTFQGIQKEDLDFDLKTTVNDVCVILDGRWDRSEFWDTLANIIGLKDGFPQEEHVKFLKKLDRQIYGKNEWNS